MLGQLKEIADRYEALVSQLEDPSVYADPARLAKLTREQKDLTPVLLAGKISELFDNYEKFEKMSQNAKRAGIKNAAERFADAIENEIIKKK